MNSADRSRELREDFQTTLRYHPTNEPKPHVPEILKIQVRIAQKEPLQINSLNA